MKPVLLALLPLCLSMSGSDSAPAPRGSYLERANPLPAETPKGKIEGRIVFDGDRPDPRELEIAEDKSKGCTKPGVALDKLDRSLLISKELGIKNAVVSIAVADAKVKVPEKPVPLDQIACVFEPHVILLPVGTTVEFLNSDTISHNVRTLPRKHTAINSTIAPGDKLPSVFDQGPDKIEIKCDFHPWMNAWLFVTDTPYAAVSDVDGKFAIDGLAPGEYKLTVWHESLPKAEATVTVRPDGSADATEIKLKKKPKRG